jgi:SAM-dependent methyltransferase
MSEYKYVGSELELFAAAHNWKTYWSRYLIPFVKGDVLEVGAGIGSNTTYLYRAENRRWACLEPDQLLANQLYAALASMGGPPTYEIICGTIQTLDHVQKFDTIIYIDVLEHIENDREELKGAAAHLREGGRIIVLAPAHQWLFTPFDAAVGHFRRYDRPMLRNLSPVGLHLERLIYLDSLGLLLSLGNRILLKQAKPTKAQIHFWDRWVVPASRVLDPCLLNSIGKSIVGVWRRPKA